MDQRAVTGPSARPAGMFQRRTDAHLLADQRHRVVDHHRLVGPEVVDANLAGPSLMRRHGSQNRLHAVSDVEVGLLLAPIPQDPQPRGVELQRTVEVDHVPVRVALPEDRHEAKHHAGEPEAVRVGADHALAGQLGRAIERGLQRKRRVLGGGKHLRLPVDRAGRGERDPAHARRAHGLQHRGGGDRVLLQVLTRTLQAMAHVGVGLEMKHPVAPLEGTREPASVEHIRLVHGDLGIGQQVSHELPTSRPEIVDDNHLDPVSSQALSEMGADEAGSAGNAGAAHPLQREPCRQRVAPEHLHGLKRVLQ